MATNQTQNLDVSAEKMASMTHTDLRLMVQRLQSERRVLRAMGSALLYLCFADLNENQKAGLSRLAKIQAQMVKIDMPKGVEAAND